MIMGHGTSLDPRHAHNLCIVIVILVAVFFVGGTNAINYVWKTGLWMDCQHYKCGKGGAQYRSVFCGEEGEFKFSEASHDKCKHLPRPKDMQSCFKICEEHQDQVRWTERSWSECQLDSRYDECAIKRGIQFRNVTCRWQYNGELEKDEVCAEFNPKPNAVEMCDLKCPQDCVVTNFTSWNNCDNCMLLNMTRTRQLVVPPAYDGKSCPAFTEMIPCDNCSEHYMYQIGPWSECVSADQYQHSRTKIHPLLGFQKRDIRCINSMGSIVAYSFCKSFLHNSITELIRHQTCIIPQDCVVSEWSHNASHNTSCYEPDGSRRHGYMIRRRSILQIPLGTGKPCPKLVHYFEVRPENEKPCPEVQWMTSSWSDCLAPPGGYPCTTGLQTREAFCVQHKSAGKVEPVEDNKCRSEPRPLTSKTCDAECDLDCTVSQWTPWSDCKVTDCEDYERRKRTDEGTGQRFRTRTVLTMAHGEGKRCDHFSETQTCDPQPCFHWNITVGECRLLNPIDSPNCGLGIAYRTLTCVNKKKVDLRVSHYKCDELGERPDDKEDCYIPCPEDCILSPWSPWSMCPNLCQEGRARTVLRSRERSILAQDDRDRGGTPCPTNRELSENTHCPTTIECAIYVWQTEPWNTCVINDPTITCGSGTQTRDVQCYSLLGQPVPDQRCTLSVKPTERQSCEVPCPINCEVTEYSDWSPCSASCWEAKQTVPVQRKERHIIQQAKHGGDPCPYKLTDVKQCTNLTLCRGFYWDTGPWSLCILPLLKIPQCGQGLQARDVICRSENGTEQLLDVCIQRIGPIPDISTTCYKSCDEECVFQEWGPWSRCVNGCSGNRWRSRKLVEDNNVNIDPKCRDTRLFPIDWFEKCLCDAHSVITIGNWSECIRESDDYTRSYQENSGETSPDMVLPPPRIPDNLGSICGEGDQYRAFACQNDKGEVEAADHCSLEFYDKKRCHVHCPLDCVMSTWSLWSDCSTSCGTGTQLRYRDIIQLSANHGRRCPSLDNAGTDTQTRTCTIECSLYHWRTYRWSPCMSSMPGSKCGNGTQTRFVRCERLSADGYSNEGVDSLQCMGEMQPVNKQSCYAPCSGECVVSEWEPWSLCKRPCTDPNQVQTRIRTILRHPLSDPSHACPTLLEEKFCIMGDNCLEYKWHMSVWTTCLVNNGESECGVGHTERYPECRDQTNRVVEDKYCIQANGESTEKRVRSCQIQCDTDCLLTQWSSWAECSNTCGVGDQMRMRTIVQQPQGNGRRCPLILEQTKPCFQQGCYTWVVSPWSDCRNQIGVCGHGIQTRNITCVANSGLAVNESNCPPDLDIIVLEKEHPCTIPCPGECVTSDWSEWNDCFIDCKDFDRGRYTRGVQSRSMAILAYAQLQNPSCPDQLWESRPCVANACLTFIWKTSPWAETSSRKVWCERSDGLMVTGGCSEKTRPASTLMCNPPCILPHSYCNDTNYCSCEDKYTSVLNSLKVLVECTMENRTALGPTPKSVTLPTDGPTNVWMYAVIAAGTIFVIFLAIACYTMSEFFHKGPRPRKKDEEKSVEGADNVEGMVAETAFITCNNIATPTVNADVVDRHSLISADRTPPPTRRQPSPSVCAARDCSLSLNKSARLCMPKKAFECCPFNFSSLRFNSHQNRSNPNQANFDSPDGVNEIELDATVHVNNVTRAGNGAVLAHPQISHTHAVEPQNINGHYSYHLHDDLPDGMFELGDQNTEIKTNAEMPPPTYMHEPRLTSTMKNNNNQSLPLYAHVDKNNTIFASTINPIQKPVRNTVTGQECPNSNTYKAFSSIDTESIVSMPRPDIESLDDSQADFKPERNIVYLNREESEPDINDSHTIDDIHSGSLKDMLKTYFDKIGSADNTENDITETHNVLNDSKPNSDEVFSDRTENENDPLLIKAGIVDGKKHDRKKRRQSLKGQGQIRNSPDHSLLVGVDQRQSPNHIVTHIYDTEDDSVSRTMSLRSNVSGRSRLSNLSFSKGPSIQINPDETSVCDFNQNHMPSSKSSTWSGDRFKKRHIGNIKFSSFDTEPSTAPSTSVSCDSLSSPRSLHSESQSEHSLSDQLKAKGHENSSEKSGRNVAIDSLKYKNSKRNHLVNMRSELEDSELIDDYEQNEDREGCHIPQISVNVNYDQNGMINSKGCTTNEMCSDDDIPRTNGVANGFCEQNDNWEHLGSENESRDETTSLLTPLHFKNKK